MEIIKWTGQVQDRLKWKGIVEKAKTLLLRRPRLYQSCSTIEEEKICRKEN
jgi:hypothetical protein